MSEHQGDPTVEETQLRVLVANERPDRLAALTEMLARMGHVVVAGSVDVDEVGVTTRREHPDVALVALGASSEHALGLVSKVVHEAACPVIALLESSDPAFVNEAAKRGVFAYITDGNSEELQATLEIVLRRFAEYHNSKAPSPAAPRSSVPKAFSWPSTASTNNRTSTCSAATPNAAAAGSWTSPKPLPKATSS